MKCCCCFCLWSKFSTVWTSPELKLELNLIPVMFTWNLYLTCFKQEGVYKSQTVVCYSFLTDFWSALLQCCHLNLIILLWNHLRLEKPIHHIQVFFPHTISPAVTSGFRPINKGDQFSDWFFLCLPLVLQHGAVLMRTGKFPLGDAAGLPAGTAGV